MSVINLTVSKLNSEVTAARLPELIDKAFELKLPTANQDPKLPASKDAPASAFDKAAEKTKKNVDQILTDLKALADERKIKSSSPIGSSFRSSYETIVSSKLLNEETKLKLLAQLDVAIVQLKGKLDKKLPADLDSKALDHLVSEVVSPVRAELTEMILAKDPKVSNLKRTGTKLEFTFDGYQVSAEVDSFGGWSSVKLAAEGLKVTVEGSTSLRDIRRLLPNLADAKRRLDKLGGINSGEFLARNAELFEVKSKDKPETVLVVSPRDILAVQPDKDIEQKRAKVSTLTKELESLTASYAKQKTDGTLEPVLKEHFFGSRLPEERIDYLLKEKKIDAKTADELRKLAKIGERIRTTEEQLELAQKQLSTRTLTGKDRFGREVKVEEILPGAGVYREAFDRIYRDAVGKEVAKFACQTGGIRTDGPGGEVIFSISKLTEILPDLSITETQLAEGIGRPVSILRKDANGKSVSSEYFDGKNLTLVRSVDYLTKREILFGADGKKVIERTYSEVMSHRGESYLKNQTSSWIYNSKGEPMSTYPAMLEKNPKLTPEEYLQKLADWCKGDDALLNNFLIEFMDYRNDEDPKDNPFHDPKQGEDGDYWQLPKQTVARVGSSPKIGDRKLMLGDCDDLAFLAQEILKRQGRSALVVGIPGHAICMSIAKNKDGKFDVLTIGTEGIDVNGKSVLRSAPSTLIMAGPRDDSPAPGYSPNGYATTAEAFNAAYHKYKKGGFGLTRNAHVVASPENGFQLLLIPAEGKQTNRAAPLEAMAASEFQKDYLEATNLLARGKSKEAIELFRKLHADSPSAFTASGLGEAYLASGDLVQSKAAFAEALKLSPRHPSILILAAIDAFSRQDGKYAAELIRKSLTIENGQAGRAWGGILQLEGYYLFTPGQEKVFEQFKELALKASLEQIAATPYQEAAYEFAEQLANRWNRQKEVLRIRGNQVALCGADYEAAKKKGEVPKSVATRYREALIILAYREQEFGTKQGFEAVNKVIEEKFGKEFVVPPK